MSQDFLHDLLLIVLNLRQLNLHRLVFPAIIVQVRAIMVQLLELNYLI